MNRRALINLKALQANYRLLQARVAPASCAAAVKANAYGIGLQQAALALASAGCEYFFVATTDEALELRGYLQDATIYVLDGPERPDEMCAAQVWPVLNDLSQVRAWSQETDSHCCLHIDSGMNRLGLSEMEVEQLATDRHLLECLQIDFVMTHLACADEPSHDQNRVQLEQFNSLRARLPAHKISIANSPGVFLEGQFHGDLVRAGVCLYGGRPQRGIDNPMAEVVLAQGRVIQLRQVEQRGFVGYGATAPVSPSMHLATIAFGYADGYPRNLGNRGRVTIGGVVVPVLGRVSMDSIVADVSSIPEGIVSVGDWATVIGDQVSIDEVADDAGTIAYELLARIGPRVTRIYKS